MNKILIFSSFLLLISCQNKSYKNEDGSIDAKGIYQDNCVSCHGENGAAGIGGAKDLSISTLSLEETYAVITNGTGNGMMAYKNIIETEAERKALAKFVLSLRD